MREWNKNTVITILKESLPNEAKVNKVFFYGDIPQDRIEIVRKIAEDIESDEILAYFDYSIGGTNGIAFTDSEIIDNHYLGKRMVIPDKPLDKYVDYDDFSRIIKKSHNNEYGNRLSYAQIFENNGIQLIDAWDKKYFPKDTIVKLVNEWAKTQVLMPTLPVNLLNELSICKAVMEKNETYKDYSEATIRKLEMLSGDIYDEIKKYYDKVSTV